MSDSAATPADLPATDRPRRVLYADDLKQLRDLMTLVLKRENYVTETAADGQEALERLIAEPDGFDLLITDHHMPRLNGLDLVARARLLPFSGRIVVFSSEFGQSVNAQYRKFGVDLILPKPIFPETLRTALRQLFLPVGLAAPEFAGVRRPAARP